MVAIPSRREFILLIAQLIGGKIVDIGCGPSPFFKDLATNVDSLSIDELKAMAKSEVDIPNFVHASAEHLPFSNLEYDVAVLAEILEHVADPVLVLNEAQRVAKYVIISVPNEYRWSEKNEPFKSPHHIHFFTRESIERVVKQSGMFQLEFIDLQYLGWAFYIIVGISKNFVKNERQSL